MACRYLFEIPGHTTPMDGGRGDPDKMRRLSAAALSADPAPVENAVSMLDDEDIRIRGEAFCALVMNRSQIAHILVKHLGDPSGNVRAFCALVLADRGDSDSAPHIVPLLDDARAQVRNCALGALGYLGYGAAADRVALLLDDEDGEVRRSAAKAASDLAAIRPD